HRHHPVLLPRHGVLRALPPFPTRRSSDLALRHARDCFSRYKLTVVQRASSKSARLAHATDCEDCCRNQSASDGRRRPTRAGQRRSEEHTSELQSRVDLVCRLLLEKKKITT